MISHFPVLYPGELLYSGCARFADRMQYPTLGATNLELFGNRLAIPVVDLPHQIDRLVANLPASHPYDADGLINQHTLLPLYAPFLPVKNYQRLREAMRGGGYRTTYLIAGITAGRVRPPLHLRSCPCCDAENINNYGETYWHRVHQVAGVEVCPVHNVFLQDSSALRINSKNRHEFHSAQQAVRSESIQRVDPANRSHGLLAAIAKNAAGIMERLRLPAGSAALRERYFDRLKSRGFLTVGGSVRVQELRDALVEFFPAPMLTLLQSDLPDKPGGGWLAPMFSLRERINAPLRHLLLLTFFGDTADSIFDTSAGGHPTAERAGYPCLNALCPDHGQPLIKSLETRRTKDRRRTLTLYRCPTCGHASTRKNAGQTLKRVIEWGQFWHEKLKLLWADLSLSVTQIKHALHSDNLTIKRHAAKAGLPFPRLRPGRPSVMQFTLDPKKSGTKFTIEERRAEYTALRKAHPAATGRQVRELYPGLITWLYRHDRQWMVQNVPRLERTQPKTVVNWQERDELLCGQVATVAQRIKNASGKPRRVAFATINHEMRVRLQVYFNPKTMPLTRLVLQGIVETAEQFCLRRIQYVAQRFIADHTAPSRSDFLRAAGINPQRKNSESIMAAIDAALASTQSVSLAM